MKFIGDISRTLAKRQFGDVGDPAGHTVTTTTGPNALRRDSLRQLRKTIGGDYLMGGPGFERAQLEARRQVQPIASQFVRSGRTNSGLAQAAITEAAMRPFADTYSDERNRQLQAINIAPQIETRSKEPFFRNKLAETVGLIGAGLGAFGGGNPFGGPFGGKGGINSIGDLLGGGADLIGNIRDIFGGGGGGASGSIGDAARLGNIRELLGGGGGTSSIRPQPYYEAGASPRTAFSPSIRPPIDYADMLARAPSSALYAGIPGTGVAAGATPLLTGVGPGGIGAASLGGTAPATVSTGLGGLSAGGGAGTLGAQLAALGPGLAAAAIAAPTLKGIWTEAVMGGNNVSLRDASGNPLTVYQMSSRQRGRDGPEETYLSRSGETEAGREGWVTKLALQQAAKLRKAGITDPLKASDEEITRILFGKRGVEEIAASRRNLLSNRARPGDFR